MPINKVFTAIFRNEGLLGFYKGNAANIVRVVPFSAVEFYTFDQVKMYLFKPGEVRDKKKLLLCGSISGVAASTATYPLDLIRTKLTMSTERVTRSIWGTAFHVVQNDGFFALYKGWLATLMGIAPYVGLKMASFDFFKPYIIPDSQSRWFTPANLFLGAAAGTFAATLTYPTDLIRRRMQLRTKTTPYSTVIGCVWNIGTVEGFSGFYRGLVPCYMKVIPSCGIAFACNEKLKSLLNIGQR
jgi:solute carrier family 25 phosphate transporter 23/24/25/41